MSTSPVCFALGALLCCVVSACNTTEKKQDVELGEWKEFLSPPPEYLAFEKVCELENVFDFPSYTVERYRQANGPGTFQRVLMAIPKNGARPFPAVVAPYYFPEAMLGACPKTGSLYCETAKAKLDSYLEVAYMDNLAKRGYVVISAESYHLTYAKESSPTNLWLKWGHVGKSLARDWPGWTGMGKLLFDTRLLVDMLCSDSRVDKDRIGIIGHSLGGKMAFYAGVADSRIKAIVASDFGFGWDQTNWDDSWYWGKKLKDVRAKGLDHSDFLSLANGKPFCLIAGKYDNASSGEMMKRAKGYENHPERLKLIDHASGHRPPRSATELGYDFLDAYLK